MNSHQHRRAETGVDNGEADESRRLLDCPNP